MNLEYKKIAPCKLREIGKDEKWLQDRITEDPSILGLGDLIILQRERMQPSGGRIDFIMHEPEEKTRYEVEVMLGTLDESHIIRTIEYWDIERRRYPNVEHVAVIVAEDITNRFFNIISILNKAVPIIALQLSAFAVESSLVLNFVKVLDLTQEEDPDEQENDEVVDRKYWANRASEQSLRLMEDILSAMAQNGLKTRVVYNRGHISVGTSGTNFTWFHPRKSARLHCEIKLGADEREAAKQRLEEKGLEPGLRGKRSISLVLSETEFKDNRETILDVLRSAEANSSR
jgi:hypothetical protein